MDMDQTIKTWIVEILAKNERVVQIAVRQRAKFEGWLKFELAAFAEQNGAKNVYVESGDPESDSLQRSDISFTFDNCEYDVELKTPNSNWRIDGIRKVNRPITKNIAGIIKDVEKLRTSSKVGIIAFVFFPIPVNSHEWVTYLIRISNATGLQLMAEKHCHQLTLLFAPGYHTDVVVCSFGVPRKTHMYSDPIGRTVNEAT